jgi:hypothetical protein
MYSFNALNASCYFNPHSKVPEPLNTLKKGKLRSAIFAMNRFNTSILPVSFCTSFLDYGGFMQTIAFILSGFASIPLTETKQPRTLPLLTPNTHFSGLSFNCAFRMVAKVLHLGFLLPARDYYVISIRKDIRLQLFLEDNFCHPAKSWSSILETFGHPKIVVGAKRHDETHLLLIFFLKPYLVIARETI